MSTEKMYKTEPVFSGDDNPAVLQSDHLAGQKLGAAIRALEDVIDYETGMLEQHRNPDYADINARKARGVRILNQTMAEFAQVLNNDGRRMVENLLSGLQVKLERNRALLEIHLEAVGELAEMLRQAQEAQEADGTYAPSSLNYGHF